jgi:Transglutaminase-like superfamily
MRADSAAVSLFPPSVRAYLLQSRFTAPGAHASLLEGLPRDVRALSSVVQGLLVHYRNPDLVSARVPKRRFREVNTRYVDLMMEHLLKLDPRPFREPRPVERRLIGCCRDFATLFVSMARHQGIPARIRVGFANYFAHAPARFWIDHTIAEYWDVQRPGWHLVDPEQSESFVKENRIDFDPAEVPWGRFIVGGQAWEMCRNSGVDADNFCVQPDGPPRGLWFVRSRLLLDLAALNREELLLWDSWSATAPDAPLTARDLRTLDRMARVTAHVPPPVATVARFYREKRWRHPPTVFCYSPVGRPYLDTLRS